MKKTPAVLLLPLLLILPLIAHAGDAGPTIEVAVSIPSGTGLDAAGARSAAEVWMEMIDGAKETIDLAEFYLVSQAGTKLEGIVAALERAAQRGVRVRILAEKKMAATYPDVLNRFRSTPNVAIRLFDWQELTGGILHAKYVIVDRRECWLGSQNFDWRSLEHIHETGVRVDDENICAALGAIFTADWAFNGGDRAAYEKLKQGRPFVFGPDLRLAASPAGFLPPGVKPSLEALTALIDGAKKTLTVQLLSYSTDGGRFTVLEKALRRAAGRGVAVKLLVSDWSLSRDEQRDLKRLGQVGGVEVRVAAIPQLPSGFIPFGRVHHSKVLRVDDDRCALSTSNWSGDYFLRSRNVEIILRSKPVAARLDSLFTSLWQSPTTFRLDPERDYQLPPREAPAGNRSPDRPVLTREAAGRFAALALKCAQLEYPNKLDHVMNDAAEVRAPRELHPAFFGCYDWHSSVHGHWMMVRLLNRFPDLDEAPLIRRVLDENLTPAAIAAEVAYFRQPSRQSFERTYGWAWLLKLQEALESGTDADSRRRADVLQPLADEVVKQCKAFFPKQTYPIRTGVHPNTAFALACAWDYAAVSGDRELRDLVRERALTYYKNDEDCPAGWEPGGEDFFSPCLMEADLMRRIMNREEFSAWFDRFLPLGKSAPGLKLLEAAIVSDRSDPKLVHLDGLNLSRAAALSGIASALPADDPRRVLLADGAARLGAEALAHVTGGSYLGEHWLGTFAVWMLEQMERM
jgi:phosphatidylserine/phosphatidylglycerophosphate/cardiolipin synthase-like enzyme